MDHCFRGAGLKIWEQAIGRCRDHSSYNPSYGSEDN